VRRRNRFRGIAKGRAKKWEEEEMGSETD